MVEVLFFAELREAIGKEKIAVTADGLTVEELKEKWLAAYQLDHLDSAMIAINEEYAAADAVLTAGDIVAFIPPVSGG